MGCTERSIRQRQRDHGLHVSPGHGTLVGVHLAEEGVEDVTEAPATAKRVPAHLRPTVAVHVVLLALGRIGENLVGGRHPLEAVLSLRVGVGIGMQLAREATVGLLDLLRRGI